MKAKKVGKLSAALSLGCAFHCLSFPMLIPFVPVLGENRFLSHTSEIYILVLAALIGLYSLFVGYTKYHRSYSPFYFFVLGIFLIIAGVFFHDHSLASSVWSAGTMMATSGGIIMGIAQLINLSMQR